MHHPSCLKDSYASLKVNTLEEEGVGVCSLVRNISRVRGTCWSFKMGTKTNSQVRIQDENNLYYNQQKRQVMQIEWKWYNEFNRDNLKHKFYTTCNFWEEAPFPFLYYILCLSMGTTSKCRFSLRLPSGSPKTLVIHIIFKLRFF